MRYLLTLCLVSASLSLLSAQGWVRLFPQDTSSVQHMIRTNDGSYIIAIGQELYNQGITLVKLTSKGLVTKRVSIPVPTTVYLPSSLFMTGSKAKLQECPDGDIILTVDGAGSWIAKLDTNFNIKWQKEWINLYPVVKIKGNDIAFMGIKKFTYKGILMTLSLDGVIKSETEIPVSFLDFEVVDDGYLGIGTANAFYKLNNSGELLKTTPHEISNMGAEHHFIKTDDGNFVVAFDSTSFFYKINKNADIIWKKNNISSTPFIAPLSNGGFVSFSQPLDRFKPNNNNNVKFIKYNSSGDSLSTKLLSDIVLNKLVRGCFRVNKSEFVYYGNSIWTREYWGGNQSFAIKTDSTGNPYPKSIAGYVKLDEDKNCTFNSNEKSLANIVINAIGSTGDTFRGITSKIGYFEIGLVNDNYILKPNITQLSKYFSLCTPSVSATVVDGKAPDTVKFSIKPLISAPLMQVDITTPFLRRCFSNTYYVQYCNKGTTLAQNAFVDITLDSLLEYQSATLPLKSKTGNIYRFNLGNVDINDCGRFEITARVRCGDSTRLNQTLCVKAKIYPDTTGTPTTSWSGANITIKGGCIGDTAVFIIKNEGTAASKSLKAKAYINEDVYEGFNVQLPAGGVMTKKYKSDKKTWRITSEQEPNHPNSTRPTAFVEPCSNEPILSLQSPAMAFSADDYALSIDEDCQPIRGSFDPNDKTGYPFGKKSIGQIPANQDLEYLIRFQNTGTDTAFTVVIKDTLPLTLDPTTIEWGTSSHPYTPSFEGKNTVIFTFNNILLVDSFTNEPKSHGFVRFRIKQMPNLQNGTKIQNSASIYFDFNPPIITNKTLHTIGADEFLSPVIETTERTNTISVSPNPFTDKTHFKLENPLLSTGQLEIFDLNGRLLQTEVVKGQEFDFNKKNLKSGIYIFKITENGQIIGQGKIAVQ